MGGKAKTRLSERWTTPEGVTLSDQVLTALGRRRTALGLRRAKDLAELPLNRVGGRIDLRGFKAPTPTAGGPIATSGRLVAQELTGLTEIHGRHLAGIDFSGADLGGMRILDSQITDCLFEESDLRGLGMWATDVEHTSFRAADLRDASIGGWHAGRGNRFSNVDFSAADLRDVSCQEESYVDCDFSHAVLRNLDFHGASFTRCRFAGLLREVSFADREQWSQRPDPNTMEDVDFSEADLQWVAFCGLDLHHVLWPTTPSHTVVSKYRCVLDHVLQQLEEDTSEIGVGLRATFEYRRTYAGEVQEVGVFHEVEFLEYGGQQELARARELIAQAEADCAKS